MEKIAETIARTGPLVLFDGLCHLCSFSVQFLAARDRGNQLWYAPAQSEIGQALLAAHGLPLDRYDSFLFLENGHIHAKSEAFLHVVRYMAQPWALLAACRIVPRPVRDFVYDRIARNRYALFGRRRTCLVPRPDLASRFLG